MAALRLQHFGPLIHLHFAAERLTLLLALAGRRLVLFIFALVRHRKLPRRSVKYIPGGRNHMCRSCPAAARPGSSRCNSHRTPAAGIRIPGVGIDLRFESASLFSLSSRLPAARLAAAFRTAAAARLHASAGLFIVAGFG